MDGKYSCEEVTFFHAPIAIISPRHGPPVTTPRHSRTTLRWTCTDWLRTEAAPQTTLVIAVNACKSSFSSSTSSTASVGLQSGLACSVSRNRGNRLNRPLGRLDHKLIRKGHPFNNGPFEKYTMTGETLYCVPNYGDCGASVPLYEWFVASEVGMLYAIHPLEFIQSSDTLLTTRKRFASNEDTNVASMGVLCYIWPLDYLSGDQAPPKRQSDDAELTSSVPHPAVQLLSPEAKEALGKSISVSDLGKPVLA